jgi:hypothetical protein
MTQSMDSHGVRIQCVENAVIAVKHLAQFHSYFLSLRGDFVTLGKFDRVRISSSSRIRQRRAVSGASARM